VVGEGGEGLGDRRIDGLLEGYDELRRVRQRRPAPGVELHRMMLVEADFGFVAFES